MGLFTDIDAEIIDVLHDLQHVEQGESAEIVFEKLSATNAPVDLVSVSSFEYDERSADNRQLPPDVLYELRIPESLLSADSFRGFSSIRHGTRRFRVVTPSPFPPSGMNRFWRFWLITQEMV